MPDALDLLVSSPQIREFLLTLSFSVAKEAGERAGKWVVDSLASKIKESRLFSKERVAKAEETLHELISSKKTPEITLMKNFWIEFLEFMFPERQVIIDKLTQELCDYMAQRIYAGLGFEQLLFDMGYQPERVRYMARFQGRRSQTSFYFDLRANFEQEYFDNLLVARVIDSRVSVPTEFVNALPSVVEDINGDPLATPATLRDHDILAIIQSGPHSRAQLNKLRQTIRTVQLSNDIMLPRLVLFSDDELTSLLAMDKNERVERVKEKLREVRPYRGLE